MKKALISQALRLLKPKNESPDLHQARLRVIVLVGCVLYVWSRESISGAVHPWDFTFFNVAASLYGAFAIEMWWRFTVNPQYHLIRRIAAVLADHSASLIVLSLCGTDAIGLIWLPLFITQGVGLRFGTRWLLFSQAVGLTAVLTVIAINPVFMAIANLALGMVLTSVILPIYFLALTIREGRAKKALESAREAAEQARGAAERANEAKSAFLATMSHELRSPLTGIVGLNEVLADRVTTQDDRQLLFEQRDAALLMLSTVNDILDTSKIEAGQMTTDAIEFSLHETIGQVVHALAYQARRKGISIHNVSDGRAPLQIVGSSVYVTRIVQNLLSNAIKFTTVGGVVIRLLPSQKSTETKPWVRIEVEDTGIGIPAEAQTRIFERFYQVDASVTRRFGGTGLGTSIVKQFVELLHGSIELRSEPGRGSCFTVEFPVELPSHIPAPEARPGVGVVGVALTDDDVAQLRQHMPACAIANDVVDAREAHATFQRKGIARVVFVARIDAQLLERTTTLAAEIGKAPDWILVGNASALNARNIGKGARLSTLPDLTEEKYIEQAISAILGGDPNDMPEYPVAVGGRAGDAEPGAGASVGESAKHSENLSVLVADDCRINQLVFKRQLQPRGYTLTCVDDGASALRAALATRFDIIILDWNMPEMDGIEVVRQVRTTEGPNRSAPVIVATAAATRDIIDGAREAGASEIMMKPFFGRDLFAMLERLVPRRALRAPKASGTDFSEPELASMSRSEPPVARVLSDDRTD